MNIYLLITYLQPHMCKEVFRTSKEVLRTSVQINNAATEASFYRYSSSTYEHCQKTNMINSGGTASTKISHPYSLREKAALPLQLYLPLVSIIYGHSYVMRLFLEGILIVIYGYHLPKQTASWLKRMFKGEILLPVIL